MPKWVCSLCSSGIKYTENELTSHILLVHNALYTLKCIICEFQHNDDNDIVFQEHFKSQHPSVVVGERLRTLEKVSIHISFAFTITKFWE